MANALRPPPRDRPLNADIVRAALQEQCPRLEVTSVCELSSGWEYDAYLVSGRWVVRFPRYAGVSSDIDRAESILSFVSESLGSAVRVPRIIMRGEPGAHFPHRSIGRELIRGVPLSDPRAPNSPELASDLGRALTRIHSIPPAGAVALGIGSQKWTVRSAFTALQELAASAPKSEAAAPEAFSWLAACSETPAEYTGRACFIHDDLQLEHIVVDQTTGRLSGILDWGGGLGDPAQDFTFILPCRGWGFTNDVLRAYDNPVDDRFRDRLDFLGRVRALGWLVSAEACGEDLEPHVRIVNDLFGGAGSS